MSTEQRIRTILQKVCRNDITIDRNESLFESGLVDSFALVDLVSALEEEFSITIPDSELSPRKFSSISRIEEYIDARNRK